MACFIKQTRLILSSASTTSGGAFQSLLGPSQPSMSTVHHRARTDLGANHALLPPSPGANVDHPSHSSIRCSNCCVPVTSARWTHIGHHGPPGWSDPLLHAYRASRRLRRLPALDDPPSIPPALRMCIRSMQPGGLDCPLLLRSWIAGRAGRLRRPRGVGAADFFQTCERSMQQVQALWFAPPSRQLTSRPVVYEF